MNTNLKRKMRVRSKVSLTKKKHRLSVFRSNKHIYAQIIDIKSGKVVASATDDRTKTGKKTKTEAAETVGLEIAKKALTKKVKEVVFDRAGYKFHGRVKALSEGARKGGLQF